MRTSKIQERECSECGEKRFSAEGSRCVMTLGCTGKMTDRKEKLESAYNGIAWTQPALWEAS